MLVAALLGIAMLQSEGRAVAIADNGFCAGISWITLIPGETVTVDDGPDFQVFRVTGPGSAWWGVYTGNAASVSGQHGPVLLNRDGVTVRRVRGESGSGAYLATGRGGWQNHFFGSVFRKADTDRAFFNRVDFSAAGQAKCERTRN